MKKILALALCLMLALTMTAFAETTATGMNITLSEIELNVGTAYVINPSLSISLGSEGESVWAEIGALIGGENVLVGDVEILNGTANFTVDGANDVLNITNADEILSAQTNMTTAQLIDTVSQGFAQLGSADVIDQQIQSMGTVEGLTVEKLGDLDYKLVGMLDETSGMNLSLRLTITLGTDKPFDLSGKNPVAFDTASGTLPETDVLTVAQEKLGALMAEESIAPLVTLISAFTGASNASAA